MAELIKFKETTNGDMKRGWHTDKWVGYVPSSIATSPTVAIPTNATGMKICYNNTKK